MLSIHRWYDGGSLYTTFIVGARYINVLHRNVPFREVADAVLELVEEKKVPFVLLHTLACDGEESFFIDNELAEITLGI